MHGPFEVLAIALLVWMLVFRLEIGGGENGTPAKKEFNRTLLRTIALAGLVLFALQCAGVIHLPPCLVG